MDGFTKMKAVYKNACVCAYVLVGGQQGDK